ncbi:MAG TPA: hypothetical protein VGQ59_17700 [Cyclobacteriaceae bacterium]|jgi:hypothetical protein|nr:hypothetical protein [Cyclobacteriaceae bacterium]
MAKISFDDSSNKEVAVLSKIEDDGVVWKMDNDLLKSYLLGKTLENLAEQRSISRAAILKEIQRSLNTIKVRLYPHIPSEFVLKPLEFRKFWLNVIEDYIIYSTTEDKANLETIFFYHFSKKNYETKSAIIHVLEQYLD